MGNDTNKNSSGVKDKVKRLVALTGAIILALMYILTLVFAITDNPETMSMFKAALILTVIVPIFLYAYQLVYRVVKGAGYSGPVVEKDDSNN